ncbi:uncharacterized protein LOC126611959 [Malus sylvestris]|uniref:uncharacterized protein LOC126611959 n=1 Tax=Malus sylvestris TaxID=3752 RepID=UPI0021ABB573|nr:uncharacterized protein LOC126611959 [Malus sylvestris]
MGVELECGVCKGEEENAAHVLLTCPFARAVWFSSPFGIRLSRSVTLSLKDWLLMVLENKEMDFDLACVIIWGIWQERNSQVLKRHLWLCGRRFRLGYQCFKFCEYRGWGVEVVLRDWGEGFLESKGQQLPWVTSVPLVESFAVRYRLQVAQMQRCQQIIVESDSMKVISVLNGTVADSLALGMIAEDVL